MLFLTPTVFFDEDVKQGASPISTSQSLVKGNMWVAILIIIFIVILTVVLPIQIKIFLAAMEVSDLMQDSMKYLVGFYAHCLKYICYTYGFIVLKKSKPKLEELVNKQKIKTK